MRRVIVWPLLAALLVSGPLMFLGLSWGLPSRDADQYLFFRHPIWEGKRIVQLAGGWQADPERGADVARHPLERQSLLIVNRTDTDRARIALRYRLYSFQPDEASTLRALAQMRPGSGPRGGLDPQLYQYGGLWIYPIGLLLKLASALDLVTLRHDIGFYVEHPEAIARFYIVARLYSATWGIVGVVAVFFIGRRISGGWFFPAIMAITFASLPVVINAAHEAKPHLAGAVLILLAALTGGSYVQTGRRSYASLAGALCGAAMGMVLSGYCAFLMLPVMVLIQRETLARQRRQDLLRAIAVGVVVYFVTNPYVLINLIFNRKVLLSNLGTTAGMYSAGLSIDSALNAASLIAAGATPLVALMGLVGGVALGFRAVARRHDDSPAEVRRRGVGLLLATPAIFLAIQFFLFAGDKPGEYGRFGLYLDAVLAIEALAAAATFVGSEQTIIGREAVIAGDEDFHAKEDRENAEFLQLLIVALLLLGTGLKAAFYLQGFILDTQRQNSRLAAARELRSSDIRALNLLPRGAEPPTLLLDAEPAPYATPPVSLWDWKLTLIPAHRQVQEYAERGQLWVTIGQDPALEQQLSWLDSTPLSWANKSFWVGAAVTDKRGLPIRK